MARASRRPGGNSNPRGSAIRSAPRDSGGGGGGSRPGPRVSNSRGSPPSARNLLEDCAGIDEMNARSRPVSRRLNLQTDDITDETGLEVGRQRDVPKTIAKASLPAMDLAELDRGLPKLPGDSGKRGAPTAATTPAGLSAALQNLDPDATQAAPRRNLALEEDLDMPETLPVGPPPADSGIMRMRMNASAVLGAVDYNDEMKGTTVEEARRRETGQNRKVGKSGRRSRRGRGKARRASGAQKPAKQQGTSTMAKASARAAKSASRRGAPAEAPRASARQSRRAAAEPSGRASRRSKATRGVKAEGNSTMIYAVVGGLGLLVIIIAIVAYASGGPAGGRSKKSSGPTAPENTAQYYEQMGEELVNNGGDRIQAADYLSKAADMYEDQGEKSKAEMVRAHAFGLRKDASVDLYSQQKKK